MHRVVESSWPVQHDYFGSPSRTFWTNSTLGPTSAVVVGTAFTRGPKSYSLSTATKEILV